MYRNTKQSLLHHSISGLMSGKEGPRDDDISGDFLKNPLRQDELMAGPVIPQIPSYPNASTESSSPDSDLEFVANTTARVRELEQEAERLEKAFQNYHRRVSRCPAESPSANRSLPTLHLLRALKNAPAGAPERCVFAEDRVASQQPLLNAHRGDESEAPDVPGSTASRSHKDTASRRLSSTPLPKARRSLDSEIYLEGKLLPQGLGMLWMWVGWSSSAQDEDCRSAASTAAGRGSRAQESPAFEPRAPGEPRRLPRVAVGVGGRGTERQVPAYCSAQKGAQRLALALPWLPVSFMCFLVTAAVSFRCLNCQFCGSFTQLHCLQG